MKTKFSKLATVLAICALMVCLCACDEWLNKGSEPTSHPTAEPGKLQVHFIDVGQGDALILRVPGGSATVIDTGPSPWAARRIARVLSRRGIREPVNLVVTHPHGDHAGGWATLARLWPFESTFIPDTAIRTRRKAIRDLREKPYHAGGKRLTANVSG